MRNMKSRISNLPISDDYYSDRHGAPCKILRATHEVIHYIRNGRTCIASMGGFFLPGENHERHYSVGTE